MLKNNLAPKICAAIYASAFTDNKGWDEKTFAGLLAKETINILGDECGFILWQVISEVEAEIISFAVVADKQKQGRGRRILTTCLNQLKDEGINKLYLEVAATNTPAINLYESVGFIKTGTRKNYYSGNTDALNYTFTF